MSAQCDLNHPPPRMSERTHTTAADNALLQLVAVGDHAAFAEYYDRVSGPLYSLALKMLGNEQEAQDALQEGMEQLWRKAPTFDPTRSAAFTWSVMLFRSRLLDRLRRRATQTRIMDRVTAAQDDTAQDDSTALHTLTRREDCHIVRKVISTLKEDQRQLLQHAFFTGLSHQDIADQTGRPVGTVKSIIRRALLQLRELLTQEGYQP